MRHRKRGRVLGRSPSHRRAMLKNLASSLILTERDAEFDEHAPKVKGRVVTTVQKAKEVRPLVEKCVTIARHSLVAREAAKQYAPSADRGTDAWKKWRDSDQWQKWNQAIAPDVAARRRALQLLGDKQAVRILFNDIAPRMADRPGGYTRVLRLAKFRLGDAGEQAILEFVGRSDRVKMSKGPKPAFADDGPADEPQADQDVPGDSVDSAVDDSVESIDTDAPVGREDDDSRDSVENAAE